MRSGVTARLFPLVVCLLATNALGQAAKAPAAAKATLLLASDVACTVKLDGERVADLQPDIPARLEVASGEYLLSATSADGQKWSKAVTVKAPKTVVKIEFAGVAAATGPAAASPKAAAAGMGTLLVFADSPVQLEIDGKMAGFIPGRPEEPGQVTFKLLSGKHFVRATSKEYPDVNAAADVLIREGAQEIVRAMVADQVAERQATLRAEEAARAEVETVKTRVKVMDLRWVTIPAGKFRIGCSSGDKQCNGDEKPTHTVQITKPFQMMATEVTAGQFRTWALSQGYEPPAQPEWSAPDVPVVNVTWNDGLAFCSAFGGRLPTEAEWEYAARGGSEEARYGSIDSVAWYADNSGRNRLDSSNYSGNAYVEWLNANGNRAHPAAGKQPNAFGLYDMLGNVWEWTGDWYGDKYYKEKVEIDPAGPSSGESRVLRGGSWCDTPGWVRASVRGGLSPSERSVSVGFRCLRETGRVLRARGQSPDGHGRPERANPRPGRVPGPARAGPNIAPPRPSAASAAMAGAFSGVAFSFR